MSAEEKYYYTIFSKLLNVPLGVDLLTGVGIEDVIISMMNSFSKLLNYYQGTYYIYLYTYEDYLVGKLDITNVKEINRNLKIIKAPVKPFFIYQFLDHEMRIGDVNNLERWFMGSANEIAKQGLNTLVNKLGEGVQKIQNEQPSIKIKREISIFNAPHSFLITLLLPLLNVDSEKVDIYKVIPNFTEVGIIRPLFLWLNLLNALQKLNLNSNYFINLIPAQQAIDVKTLNTLLCSHFVDALVTMYKTKDVNTYYINFLKSLKALKKEKKIRASLIYGDSIIVKELPSAGDIVDKAKLLINKYVDHFNKEIEAVEVIMVLPYSTELDASDIVSTKSRLEGVLSQHTSRYFVGIEKFPDNSIKQLYILLRIHTSLESLISYIEERYLNISEHREDFETMIEILEGIFSEAYEESTNTQFKSFIKSFMGKIEELKNKFLGEGGA